MIALALAVVLSQFAPADAPLAQLGTTVLADPSPGTHAWLVPMGSPDGGVAVCMDSPTAVADAQSLVALRKENADLTAYVEKQDPGYLKVAVAVVVGLLAGAGITAGALGATGHLR